MHAGAAHANCLPYSTVLVNEVMVPYHMQYQYPVLTCVTTITHWILRPWSNSPSLVLSKTQELGKILPLVSDTASSTHYIGYDLIET